VKNITIYNTLKGWLETVNFEFTTENTTWFDDVENYDIYWIADAYDGLLIQKTGYVNVSTRHLDDVHINDISFCKGRCRHADADPDQTDCNDSQDCFCVEAKLEFEVRSAKRGLWADPDPVAPWEWRRQK